MTYHFTQEGYDEPRETVWCPACGLTMQRIVPREMRIQTTHGKLRLREVENRDLCPRCHRGHLGIKP